MAGLMISIQAAVAAPKLSLSSTYAFAGSNTVVELRLSGATTPCAGVNAKIILPSGVKVTGVDKGGLLYPGQFAVDYRPFDGGGGATVIAYSGTDVFSSGDGVLLQLHLSVPAQLATNTYPITFAPPNTNVVKSSYALSDATGDHSLAVTPESGTLIVDADSKGKGMGDAWQLHYFGNLDHPADEDFDGDGLTNLREFQLGTDPTKHDTDGDGMSDGDEVVAGTNPLDPGDCFKIKETEVVSVGGPFVLYWDSKPGRSYAVYASTNLTSGWSQVAQVTGDGTRKAYTNSAPGAQRLFRLGVQPIP
jgi:hypothetical protein